MMPMDMGCMTWLVMYGSGVTIGMMGSITMTALEKIRRDLAVGITKFCAAVLGAMVPAMFVVLFVATTALLASSTSAVFAASGISPVR